MSILRIIILDVGWGDSILLETIDDRGRYYHGLVDSNDTSSNRFTLNFLKRRCQTLGINYKSSKPFFDFVLLSHAHTDHGQGLKSVIQEFGTKQFWYSKSNNWGSLIQLLNYARRSSNVDHHQAIDSGRQLPKFGDVELDILWPIYGKQIEKKENNNSVVMTLSLNQETFLLSGDAEEEVWSTISKNIPAETSFFKVPHHGSIHGSFDANDNPVWLNNCPNSALLGISCHVGRYGHPHKKVIKLFESESRKYYRTDEHYHLIVETDGSKTTLSCHQPTQ